MRSKFEIRCEKTLQEQGYMTDYKIRPSIPMKNAPVDYFHLGDILAVKQDEFRFISVKGAHCSKQHKQDLHDFAQIVPVGVSVELWRYSRDLKDKRKLRTKITVYDRN